MPKPMPSYSELLKRSDAPPGSSWGLFGADDQVGMANLVTEETTLAGVRSVRRGAVFNLDHPVNHFPPLAAFRPPAQHTVFEYRPHHLDDRLDSFALQGSSHIDGLRHAAHHRHGFYNGHVPDPSSGADDTLGVNRWAAHGIAGRGVLLDVARHREALGRPLDHRASQEIDPTLLDEVAAAQGVSVRPGDLVLIRTDWPRHFFAHAGTDFELAKAEAGLAPTEEMLGWLWDHGVALAAADNFALEAYPERPGSTFAEMHEGHRVDGLIHPSLIALLGLVVGELWNLEELAADCAVDRVYEFLCICKPINLVGGVGSPANALAIK